MMSLASSSSSSATVAVEKATSNLLIGPDWTMNIDICDSLNSHHWQAKDVVKALKKRLQHKNPKVQLLALTLLETMVKNCGDYVHFQIAEKNILGDMVKIVKKKTDMHVRDKILVLLDSWQEVFGGPGGKYPQYYWAYEDLRRTGVEFPQRSSDAAPIITPPVTHPALRHTQPGHGMPSNSPRTLDETMATDIEGLSLSSLEAMHDVMELLNDMLQVVNPRDREAVKDEVIVDLVRQCRSNQRKLMQMLTTTGDEELLGRGLKLNDGLQILLAKHDAIASGSPMRIQITESLKPSEESSSNVKPAELRDSSPRPRGNLVAPGPLVANLKRGQIDEEEEEEDDFAQLARRHSKTLSSSSQSSSGTGGVLVPADTSSTSSAAANTCYALALPDPPAPVRTTKEQDMIDLLSITLSTVSTSPHPPTPQTPPASYQSMPQIPVSSGPQGKMPQMPISSGTQGQGHLYGSQTYHGNQGQVPFNSYVVPWAAPQPQHRQQPPSGSPLQPQPQQRLEPSSQQQQYRPQPQPQFQPQFQPRLQPQYPQYSSGYPPPPWAATPGYANGQNQVYSSNNNTISTAQPSAAVPHTPTQTARPLQHYSSFPYSGTNVSVMNGDPNASPGSRNPTSSGSKPFIPSYRLFEDLNVLGNADGRFKMTSSASPSLSGTSGRSMVGGRK